MKKLIQLFLTLTLLAGFAGEVNGQIATNVVISEVYGGGGNSGSYWKQDYIELYNPTNSPISLAGWSVQYASAAGTSWTNKTDLSGTIPARGFFLIQQAAQGGGTVDLPTPDVTGTIAMGATAGKVALVNTTTALSGANPSSDPSVIDFVGYGSTATGFEGTGPTVAPSNTQSVERKAKSTSTADSMGIGGIHEFNGNGWDTNNNSADFLLRTGQPQPQNTASATEIPPVIGNTPPIISSVIRTIFVAEVSGTDTVRANITDIDGTVAIAKLHVRVNRGNIDSSFVMAVVSGSLYQAVIPTSKHVSNGDLVEYFVSATDNSGGYSTTASTPQGYFVGNTPISSMKSYALSSVVNYGVRVNGTVNVRLNTHSSGQGYIQDATGGLQIYVAGGLPNLDAGRNAKVQGTIINYLSAFELTTPNFAWVDTTLGTTTLTPVTITLPITQAPDYVNEGKLVKVVGVSTDSTGSFVASRNYIYRETDLDTITIRVENNATLNLNNLVDQPIPTSPVDANGILSFWNGYHRIKPRNAQDLGFAGGDGSGTATISPILQLPNQIAVAETITVTGDGINTLEGVSVALPSSWTWNGTSLTLTGTGTPVVTGDGSAGTPWIITVSGASITNVSPLKINIQNLNTPSVNGITTFTVRTRISGGALILVASQPTVNIVTSLPFIENFEYTTGSLLTANGWATHSGTANPIAVNADPLTYTDYTHSGVGKSVTLTTTGEDVNRAFSTINTGSVYASFMIRVDTALTGGEYFFHLSPSGNTSSHIARVYFKKDVSNNVAFGVSKGSATAEYTAFNYALSNTYLIVLKYTFNTGSTTDDEIKLWINPALTGIEPTADLITSPATTDPTSLGVVALRQGSGNATPAIILGGLRINTAWLPSGEGTFDISVSSGWNMLSVPLTVVDYRKIILFPTAQSSAFAYDAGYLSMDTLKNGVGYWLKFNANQNIPMSGLARTSDSVIVSTGWNMVGSVSSLVPKSKITTSPGVNITSQFYQYQAGYTQADTVFPGKAYWVKVSAPGKLYFIP